MCECVVAHCALDAAAMPTDDCALWPSWDPCATPSLPTFPSRTAQCSAVRCSAVGHGAVQWGAVRCHAPRCTLFTVGLRVGNPVAARGTTTLARHAGVHCGGGMGRRQAFFINVDPYANAFQLPGSMPSPHAGGANPDSSSSVGYMGSRTEGYGPLIFERKFEVGAT
jgi:hypothetical protein